MHDLNKPIKKQKLPQWIKKKTQLFVVYKKTHFKHKDTGRLKVKKLRTLYHAITNQTKARVAILIPDTADFRTKK